MTDPDDELQNGEAGGPDLSPREAIWVRCYGDPQSPTFGCATASAKAAGYSESRSSAWRLRRRPHIRKALEALYDKVAVSLAGAMASLEATRIKAMEAGDFSTAARCAELQVKRYGGFLEMHLIASTPQVRQLSEAEQEEARRLVGLRLDEMMTPKLQLPAAEAAGQQHQEIQK